MVGQTLNAGTELAGYRIDGVAGVGGMGVVYRATQLGLGRPVALKLISREHAGDESFRARFKQESQLAALIDHPNVLPVYEAGEAGGLLFIAMRFVAGSDLRALLEREPLDPARAVQIVGQVAAALDAAHRRGLVHRDVKPANVLLDAEGGHAYLTDFGVSKLAGSSATVTRAGVFVGTIHYVAPEQIRGEQVDGRADVYALGCVLYHALAGAVPFDRDSDVATLQSHLNEPPPKLGTTAMDAVIERALAKDPAARFATAGELAAAARAALDDSSPSPWPRRRRIALGAALPTVLATGLVAAALAAAGALGGGEQPSEPTLPPSPTPTVTPTPEPQAVATIPVGDGPDGLVVQGDRVFVVNAEDGTLSQIDAESDSVEQPALPVGTNPDGVAAGGALWVTNVDDDQVQLVQTELQLLPTAKIDVGDAPQGVALGEQLAWVANTNDGTVTRIDRATATTVGGPIASGTGPTGIFVGRDTVWVTNKGDDTVQRIDIAGAVPVGEPIPVGDKPHGVVEAGDSVWVANAGDATVTRIDRATGEVIGGPIPVGREPRELTVGRGYVWVANTGDNSVTRIDRGTGEVTGAPIPVGTRPLGIDIGAGSVWVANSDDGTVTRIRP